MATQTPTDAGWSPFDAEAVRRLAMPPEAAEGLTGRGLPQDCNRMFVRVPDQELRPRETPSGRAVYLGAFEEGALSYWLLLATGEVLMSSSYDGDGRAFTPVNSSVAALQQLLHLWDSFVHSGRREEDSDYDDYVTDLIQHARRADPAAFTDENAWWSRVFEEVELGVLGPE